MFNQTRYKNQITRKVGGAASFGRHKMLVNMKTGMGFWSSIKGFFSKLAKKAAPVVKKMATEFVNSGQAQTFAKNLVKTGADKLSNTITKKFGPRTDGLTSKIKEFAEQGADKLTSEGTKMALDLLGKGVKVPKKGGRVKETGYAGKIEPKNAKEIDLRIKSLLKGSGLSII